MPLLGDSKRSESMRMATSRINDMIHDPVCGYQIGESESDELVTRTNHAKLDSIRYVKVSREKEFLSLTKPACTRVMDSAICSTC